MSSIQLVLFKQAILADITSRLSNNDFAISNVMPFFIDASMFLTYEGNSISKEINAFILKLFDESVPFLPGLLVDNLGISRDLLLDNFTTN